MSKVKNIKELVKKLRYDASSQISDKIFDNILQEHKRIEQQKLTLTQPNRRIIMKSPITKLAVAAIVIIACVIGLSLWKTTGSGIAMADVLASVEKIKTYKYTWAMRAIPMGMDPDPNWPYRNSLGLTNSVSEEYGWRDRLGTFDPNDGKLRGSTNRYILPKKKLFILINTDHKTYQRRELDDAEAEEIQKESDPFWSLKGVLQTKFENLDKSTMDGIEVIGFQITDPNKVQPNFRKIWVDVKTLLPVRIYEFTSSEVGEPKKKLSISKIMYNFQWDVYIDVNEFEPPAIPEGYEVTDIFLDSANEENAIEGLKQCVELLGSYPERIDFSYLWSGVEKSGSSAAMRLKEELKGLTGFERDNKKMNALKPMRLLNGFFSYLGTKQSAYDIGLASRESAYYWKVTPKDVDKVLMRWKVSEDKYRVIFGDLHTETVTPEKLAELEKLNPKEEPTMSLYEAARAGNIEQIKLFVSQGADVDVNDKENGGQAPLHVACINSRKDIVELLIAAGANVNAKTNSGITPLHFAVRYQSKEIVELLIAKGADINAKDNNGGTALSMALSGASSGYLSRANRFKEIVELLHEHGAEE
jgi:hypothetical protein